MTDRATSSTEGENWVNAETDPKAAAAVAKQVDSEEWTFLKTLYYASCCDCGLTHRVDVRTVDGGYEVRHARMDDYTAEIRKQRDFPLLPRSSGGASAEPVNDPELGLLYRHCESNREAYSILRRLVQKGCVPDVPSVLDSPGEPGNKA